MDFINEITSETLIISNTNIKDIFMSMKILKPIKFMKLDEFLSKYYYSYDEDTISYIMNKYNVKYDIALEYLSNLYYVEDMTYGISKLDFLVNLKKELDDNKLLRHNDLFHKYLSHTKIILYDIDMDEFLTKTFKDLDYKCIYPEYNNYQHKVYKFNTISDEINYVAKSIAKLIDSGVETSAIKLTNVGSDYYNTLERIFSLYNLKVNIPYRTKLISYPLVKDFINEYKESDENISIILERYDKDNKIYPELVKVINKYIKYYDKELMIYKIENSLISSNKYDKGIDIVDYLNYIPNKEDYIFMISFNEGCIPKYTLDTDYITDNISAYVGLNTSVVKNKIIRDKTKKIINNIKNLTITYKERDYKNSCYPSTLCSDYEVTNYVDDNVSYSELNDKIKLVSSYDDYFKYGYINPNFDILNSNYQINYNSFSNKYQKIDRVMDKLNLSYSKMNIYNKCAFRYYLSDILKLDIFEENFSVTIGSLVHHIMESCLKNNDNDIHKYVMEYVQDKPLSKKEMFFLKKYEEHLGELLDEVILEKEYYLFNQAMYEERIDIDYGDNIHFVGVIDKILYYIDGDTTYVALVDYKTGNDQISLKYLKYGLDIQLPIYLYLATRLPFKDIKYTGFYLQKFNIKDRDYRLVGYSNSNKDTLKVIDKDYDNSRIIKGLKTNKDGSFSRYAKVLSDEEIDTLISDTKNVIDNVIDKIRNNEFTINPKVDNGINLGCAYCKFKDICFKDISDEVNIYPEER